MKVEREIAQMNVDFNQRHSAAASAAKNTSTSTSSGSSLKIHAAATAEIRLIQEEASDRHVIEALELYAVSGSTGHIMGDSDRGSG